MLNWKFGTALARASGRSFHPWRWLLVFAGMLILGLAAIAAYVAWLWPSLPTIEDLRDVHLPQPSVLLAADGSRLAVFRQARQEKVDLRHISPQVVKALIAT